MNTILASRKGSGCLALICLVCGPLVQAAERGGAPRPNILLIVADDLGYGDLGVHGCKDIPTPHIDSLARQGVRFSNGYVSGPYCSPTRAGLMTGRYQQRFGHEFNPGPARQAGANFGLPLKEVTLADRLNAAGYATGLVGKWHLGFRPEFHPLKRGFQEYFGFLGGAHPYLPAAARTNNAILRGLDPVEEKEYLTDALLREALGFIDRHQKEPFFLYLAFNAVHMPLQASERRLDRFQAIKDERRRTYAAMLAALDDAVGAVLAKLRTAGLEEDTLIFFLSDNGGPPVNGSTNGPLRGFKAQTFEGGIRVPFFAHWKGHLPAGRVYDPPVIQLDLYPTVLAAAGVKPSAHDNLDGVNLLPYLEGKSNGSPHQALFWRFGQQMAMRAGDWKLVRARNTPMQLFNLSQDPGEQNDLRQKEPGKAKELQAQWDRWNAELVPPLWGPQSSARPRNPARRARG